MTKSDNIGFRTGGENMTTQIELVDGRIFHIVHSDGNYAADEPNGVKVVERSGNASVHTFYPMHTVKCIKKTFED